MTILRFKVGDKARIIDKRCKHYGYEGTIIKVLSGHPKYVAKTKTGTTIYIDYLMDIVGTRPPTGPVGIPGWGIADESLEPILNTGQELGSWEEIQKTIGWNPTETKHKA